jgi:hypothetical protein
MDTNTTDNDERDLTELGDEDFMKHWSALRQRLALGGKSVPCDLKRRYAAAKAEYRRRMDREP